MKQQLHKGLLLAMTFTTIIIIIIMQLDEMFHDKYYNNFTKLTRLSMLWGYVVVHIRIFNVPILLECVSVYTYR